MSLYETSLRNVLSYLERNYYHPDYRQLSHLDRIRYYITKYTIYLPDDIGKQMDAILQHDIFLKTIIDMRQISPQISVIQYDITQIKTDAIVNAANENGLGCFDYGHKCLDNLIHSKAGPNMRVQCEQILKGSKIPVSGCILTHGFNLPAKYVIHAVGPIYHQNKHQKCCQELANSYVNCLELAKKYQLQSLVFCCLSTGVFHFPAKEAAQIAISTVKKYLEVSPSCIKIVFCTYTQHDYELYNSPQNIS